MKRKIPLKYPLASEAIEKMQLAMERAAVAINKFSETVNSPGLRKVLKNQYNSPR